MTTSESLNEALDEREFELVNIVGSKLGSNQRDLSRLMDMSLGMVNMLLRRLVAKGYIRIKQLNKRKVEYLLTSKGFSEKMRKSVKYTLKTIHSLGIIRNRLREILKVLVEQGGRKFVILGESDFSILVELVLKELCQDYEVQHINDLPAEQIDGFLLICKEKVYIDGNINKINSVDVVEGLAECYTASQISGRD